MPSGLVRILLYMSIRQSSGGDFVSLKIFFVYFFGAFVVHVTRCRCLGKSHVKVQGIFSSLPITTFIVLGIANIDMFECFVNINV